MVLINYAGREINAKIVYYGPGLSGKTTNLECIYASVPTPSRGKMVSMKTRQDRTLFFDFLPLELGEVHGFRTRFLLYTVPGQVFYNATRKLVLKGADAVVFVADSGLGKMPENLESLHNLDENLREQGLALETMPFVLQYNKRDLPQLHTIEELEEALNPRRVPSFEAAAATGRGVYETLHAVSRLLFQRLMNDLRPGGGRAGVAPAGPVPAGMASAMSRGASGTGALAPGTRSGSGATPRGVPVPVAGPARRAGAPPLVSAQGLGAPGAPHRANEYRQQAPSRSAPPELVEPSPWQEGEPQAGHAAGSHPGDVGLMQARSTLQPGEVRPVPQEFRSGLFGTPAAGHVPAAPTSAEILDTVRASAESLGAEAPSHAPAEYPQYGHVVDLQHSEPEPQPEPTGGFIKDPLRRTEKPGAGPGRGGAPTTRPTRTQYVSVVLNQAELRPGGTIRIVLDLQVEP